MTSLQKLKKLVNAKTGKEIKDVLEEIDNEGMCKDCGKVPINNAESGRCGECEMEYREYLADKYRED